MSPQSPRMGASARCGGHPSPEVSNVSDPPGLLLFDARCVDGSTGGAVVLKVLRAPRR